MKCLQIVNAFAVITAFSDQILVNIGDRVRVRVDPTRVSKDAREPCRPRARKGRADAWLNDRVSANYVATIRRKPGLIQRMRESFDHPSSGVAQQLSIGVQSDDKPNALELRTIAGIEKSLQFGRGLAAEKSIELLELAALALPADPALLGLAPQAAAMEKKEVPRPVSAVQFLDASSHDVDVSLRPPACSAAARQQNLSEAKSADSHPCFRGNGFQAG